MPKYGPDRDEIDSDSVEDDGSEDTHIAVPPFITKTSSVIILFAKRYSLIFTLQVGGLIHLCHFKKTVNTDRP